MIDIRCSGVSHRYSSGGNVVEVLDRVDLEVERGKLCVIVGPSGCGKSTLLRILLGLEDASEGSIWIDPDRRKGGMAYVPQNAMLLPWRTALQNASLGTEIKGTTTRETREYLIGQFGRYGLRGFEDAMWGSLSGGMRQKVAIICALSSRPQVLICDEPFSAIDFVSRLELLNQFKNDCEMLGVTTVFVTHNIEEAIFLGDTICVFSRRPAKLCAMHTNQLVRDAHDSVKVRDTPEFQDAFRTLWNDLKSGKKP